jgi:hypothetical protein
MTVQKLFYKDIELITDLSDAVTCISLHAISFVPRRMMHIRAVLAQFTYLFYILIEQYLSCESMCLNNSEVIVK